MIQTVVGWVLFPLLFVSAQAQNVYKDPTADIESRVEDLLSLMTLREKVGQMIMDAENTPENAPDIGAYLIGVSDGPGSNTPQDWRERVVELNSLSSNQRLGIPLIIGTDAVHGHNVVSGGTIFPHNIGLGATRNPSLVRSIGQATAEELITTALDMTFAPTLAVARTMTWGRTYEAYSEDTDTVRSYTIDFIEGLQGQSAPWNVIATAKHWIGDGGTVGGEDAGDTIATEEELMAIHGAPYIDAIQADVGVIMASFNSVNGVGVHEDPYLTNQLLKAKLGFDGFVLSDWEGYTRNNGDYNNQIQLAVNAGIDMLMAPYQSYQIFEAMTNLTDRGLVTEDRIDDAVRRILRVKFKAGLFEKTINPSSFQPLGTDEHRAIARQAVRESLVLLKNDGGRLPLPKTANILLVGKSADNIQNQCGGWTMSWQGTSDEERHTIVGGTTIRAGLEQQATGTVTFSQNGAAADPADHDAAIIVVGETPYAEFEGDEVDLSLDTVDLTAINNVKNAGVPIVLVLISGRPMIITDEIEGIDAVVAAWLPGTEGDGIAEVLYGDFDFLGKLPFSWPRNMGQVLNGFVGDNPNVLFPFGHGLDYESTQVVVTPAPTVTVTDAPSPMPSDEVTAAPSPMPSEVQTSQPSEESVTDVTLAPTSKPSAEESTEEPDSETTPQPSPMPFDSDSTMAPLDSDDEPPTTPGDPYVTALTSSSISFFWTRSTDNVGVAQYHVYEGDTYIGSTPTQNYTVTGLPENSRHSYTVVAEDTSGNDSGKSEPVEAVTLMYVDDFGDENGISPSNWGVWRSSFDGTRLCTLQTDHAGFTGYGARLTYEVDSGVEAAYCNMFLDFDDGNVVDLIAQDITGVQFMMQGSGVSSVTMQIGTTKAEWIWIYYQYELEPTEDWSLVTVVLDQFVADGAPYTLTEALQNAVSLVWESNTVGEDGWFTIDNVDFLTSESYVPVSIDSGGAVLSISLMLSIALLYVCIML